MMSPLSTHIFASLCFTVFNLVNARVDLGGGHRGLTMTGTTCSGASGIACTELGDDWPDMGLACPEAHHDIPRHTLAMMSATIIQLGHYKPAKEEEFPVNECYTIRPNSTVASYGFISQGSFDMWFFAHDKCDCRAEQTPVCHDRATEADKCNLRTFTLCKVTKKQETCKPKHHAGWKPSTERNQDHGNHKQVNKTLTTVEKYRFNPAYRQQSIFNDLSNFGWKFMEILGFWGII